MKRVLAALTAVAFLAAPAAAQSKLDQAIAKADEQLAKGKPEDAVKTLTKAAGEAGAEGQVALARLQERIGNFDVAAEAYGQAKASASGPGRADILADVANFTLRRGKAADALAIAKQAVEAGATPAALGAMARAQVRMEDGPGALATADKAVAAGAGSAIAHVARGEALIAMGKNPEAEAALRQAIQIDPKSALAYSRLARVQLALARPADALASARKATTLDDKFGEGFAVLGVAIVAENLKNWSDAITQAQQGALPRPRQPARAERGRQDLRGERAVRAGGERVPPGPHRGPRVRPGALRPHPGRAQPRQPRRRRSRRPRRSRPAGRRARTSSG